MADDLYGDLQDNPPSGTLYTGLYEGLFVTQSSGQHESYLQHKVDELEEHLRERLKETQDLRAQLRDREEQLARVASERDTLLRNISCLFNTAKEEMARKQAEINSLRSELSQAKNQHQGMRQVSSPRRADYPAGPVGALPGRDAQQPINPSAPSLPAPRQPLPQPVQKPVQQSGAADAPGRKRSRAGSEDCTSDGCGEASAGEPTGSRHGDRSTGSADGFAKRQRHAGSHPSAAETVPRGPARSVCTGDVPEGVRRLPAPQPSVPSGYNTTWGGDNSQRGACFRGEAGEAPRGYENGRGASHYGGGGAQPDPACNGQQSDRGFQAPARRATPAAGGSESGELCSSAGERAVADGRHSERTGSWGRGERRGEHVEARGAEGSRAGGRGEPGREGEPRGGRGGWDHEGRASEGGHACIKREPSREGELRDGRSGREGRAPQQDRVCIKRESSRDGEQRDGRSGREDHRDARGSEADRVCVKGEPSLDEEPRGVRNGREDCREGKGLEADRVWIKREPSRDGEQCDGRSDRRELLGGSGRYRNADRR